MAFKDHGEAILRGLTPKRLPYKGKTYTFPASVSSGTGLLLARIRNRAVQAADSGADLDEAQLQADVLDGLDEFEYKDMRAELFGDAQWELIKDDVPEAVVDHMESTLIVWHLTGSEEAAEERWNDVGGPKAPADRKAKSSASMGKRSKQSVKRTRSRASTGSTSRSGSSKAQGGPTS